MPREILTVALLALILLPRAAFAGEERQINKAFIDSLRQERQSDYSEPQSPLEQLFSKIWAEGMEWLSSHIFKKATRAFWEGMGYLIAILFILYLAHMALSGRFRAPLRHEPGMAGAPPLSAEDPETIDPQRIETLLQQAVEQGNWPLAAHFLYLRLLKAFIRHSLIDWQASKTNHDYIRELSPGPLRERFSSVTHRFEMVWYGARPLDRESFGAFRNECAWLERHMEKAHV